ncbi:MAG TPA: indole-3-glycerol-phosphate synthase [Steroidobacteraceae bacterium]|nr:indole-3-glycerol-phosphate synthase [Steroidobacteraceae bacterium]
MSGLLNLSGLLDEMSGSSALRVREALQRESLAELERRARAAPPPPALRLSSAGFDVIAELKLRSPAAGVLKDAAHDWRARVSSYARGGAAAVSVLTEPTRFDGALEHLEEAARILAPLGIPAMRKDFLVDPYQVLEARAAGAGGVLVIVRMLRPGRAQELLDAAAEHGLFVLLEAFDAADLELARLLLERRTAHPAHPARVLVGINCRDLSSLRVDRQRFAELAPMLPPGAAAVAESGVATASDALAMRRLGYRAALIGTALMTRDDPDALLTEILSAARTVRPQP